MLNLRDVAIAMTASTDPICIPECFVAVAYTGASADETAKLTCWRGAFECHISATDTVWEICAHTYQSATPVWHDYTTQTFPLDTTTADTLTTALLWDIPAWVDTLPV